MTDIWSVPTALYRLWSANDVLLYVGISNQPATRFDAHRCDKAWWRLVEHKDVVWMANRHSALSAESKAIATEDPLFNSSGNGGRDLIWHQMLNRTAHPILHPQRIPAFAEAAQLEPELAVLLREVQRSRGQCGECLWPDIKARAGRLVGLFAENPAAQGSGLYEAVMATLYESLPWSCCELCGAA